MASRVLIISLRSVDSAPLGYGALFEFEDAIQRFDRADRVDIVTDQNSWRVMIPHRINTAVRMLSGGRFGNSGPIPWPADAHLDHDYDLAFFVVDGLFHMRLVNLVRDVRKRCRTMALYVQESWPHDYEDRRIRTQPYQLFDYYFFDVDASNGRFAAISRRQAHNLNVACDTLRFASSRPWSERMVDVSWVGRRDPATHERVAALCERRGWRYYYDPFESASSRDPLAQRRWLGALMGDTRFAVSNFARANQPRIHRGQRFISSRFAEGAAAGNVLAGALPDAKYLDSFMPWPDAAFEAGDRPDVLIDQLADDPARMARISRRNTCEALRRHDWAHRWTQVLDTVGLPREAALQDYLARLELKAREFDDSDVAGDVAAVGMPAAGTPAAGPSAEGAAGVDTAIPDTRLLAASSGVAHV